MHWQIMSVKRGDVESKTQEISRIYALHKYATVAFLKCYIALQSTVMHDTLTQNTGISTRCVSIGYAIWNSQSDSASV